MVYRIFHLSAVTLRLCLVTNLWRYLCASL